MKHARGFTLIEMMVALFIGVVIALMAGQLYILSMRTAISQERAAEEINHQSFVLPNMISNVRLAGLGIDGSVLDRPNPMGVLIDADQLSRQETPNNIDRYLTGVSRAGRVNRINIPSEQLTIIYRAPQDMWDCEGDIALGPRRARLKGGEMAQVDGQVVIERYFVQADDGVMNLRCDAARFAPESIKRDSTRDRKFSQSSTSYINAIIDADAKDTKKANVVYGLGRQGAIMASHVEGLWVQLGVQMPDGIRLMTIADYQKSKIQEPIVTINLALLSRSVTPLSDGEAPAQSFDVFGTMVHINEGGANYDRQLHQISIALRNAKYAGDAP